MTLVYLAIPIGILLLAMNILSAQGCAKKSSPEERVTERQKSAFRIVMHMEWVRHPDIKGICFGVSVRYRVDGGTSGIGLVALPCKDVEHLLVNPTPSGLPEGGEE
jgi:hypothetical protein